MSEAAFIKDDQTSLSGKRRLRFEHFFRYIRPFFRKYLFAFSLMALAAVSAMVSARFMGRFVEEGLLSHDWKFSFYSALLIIALEATEVFLAWRGSRLLSTQALSSAFEMRRDLAAKLERLPFRYFDRQPEGRTVTRVTHDVEGVEEFLSNTLSKYLNALLLALVALVAMFLTHTGLAIAIVVGVFPALILVVFTNEKNRILNREISRTNSASNAKLSELLRGMPVIRAFGLESWSESKYRDVISGNLKANLSANTFNTITRSLIEFLCDLPLIALIGVGGIIALKGQLGIGILVTFIRYCGLFSRPIVSIAREIHIVQKAFASAERIWIFLEEDEETDVLGENGTYGEQMIGAIGFKNVSMSYDGKSKILKKVNFEIQPGQKIGIVGKTGSGKTTIISLLGRYYPYQDGEILIDGRKIEHWDRSSIRSQIGYVSQTVVLFKGTLRQNLTAGVEIDEEGILSCCKKTGLLKIMIRNAWTLDSEVYEEGANLSAGEKQLISLTRILIRSPKILILDEATANVDPAFELIIKDAVQFIMQGRTCLMIAHRLASLNDCDRFLVFSDGQLIEDGTRAELLNSRGKFASLVSHFDQPN